MPEPEKWDVYSTHILTDEEIQEKKDSMVASLFAANYELRHIAAEEVIFEEEFNEYTKTVFAPVTGDDNDVPGTEKASDAIGWCDVCKGWENEEGAL